MISSVNALFFKPAISTKKSFDVPPKKKMEPQFSSSKYMWVTATTLFSLANLYLFYSYMRNTSPGNKSIRKPEAPTFDEKIIHGPLTCLQAATLSKIDSVITVYIEDVCHKIMTSSTIDAFKQFEMIKTQIEGENHQPLKEASLDHFVKKATHSPIQQFLPEIGLKEACVTQLAAYLNDAFVIKFYKEGFNLVNKQDRLQRTPLHYAALRNHADAVKALLKRGANPNLADIGQDTPLHDALIGDVDPELIRSLLNSGANPKLLNDQGFSAFDLANRTNNHAIIQMIEEGLITYNSQIKKMDENKVTINTD